MIACDINWQTYNKILSLPYKPLKFSPWSFTLYWYLGKVSSHPVYIDHFLFETFKFTETFLCWWQLYQSKSWKDGIITKHIELFWKYSIFFISCTYQAFGITLWTIWVPYIKTGNINIHCSGLGFCNSDWNGWKYHYNISVCNQKTFTKSGKYIYD